MSEHKKNFPEEKTPAAAFHVRESILAGRLGVSRDVLRYLRQQHLAENIDFARIAKSIQYTTEAVETVRKLVDLPPEELQKLIAAAHEEKPSAEPDAEETAPQPVTTAHPGNVPLKVWRSFSTKKADGTLQYNGILEAYKPGTDPENPDNLVRVTVRSGQNYVRHMEIPARLLAGDLYECLRPDPRWRGSW